MLTDNQKRAIDMIPANGELDATQWFTRCDWIADMREFTIMISDLKQKGAIEKVNGRYRRPFDELPTVESPPVSEEDILKALIAGEGASFKDLLRAFPNATMEQLRSRVASMKRDDKIEKRGDEWHAITETPAAAKAPTLAEYHEEQKNASSKPPEQPAANSWDDIREALDELGEKLGSRRIQRLDIKTATLTELAKYLDPTIAVVLQDIRSDLEGLS